jgi:hypothetical protein
MTSPSPACDPRGRPGREIAVICCLTTEVDYVLPADPEAPSRTCCHRNHLAVVVSSPGALSASRQPPKAPDAAGLGHHSKPEPIAKDAGITPAARPTRIAPVPHANCENIRPLRRLTIEATINL